MSAKLIAIVILFSVSRFSSAAELEDLSARMGFDFQELSMAAESGDPIAQSNLGHIYFQTAKSDEDYDIARNLYESSLENGNGKVGLMLSQIYELGLGVAVSYERARQYLRIAADSGEIASMCKLSEHLKTGTLGFQIDAVEARTWEEKLEVVGFDCRPFLLQ